MQSQSQTYQKPMDFVEQINPLCKQLIMERILEYQRIEMARKRTKDGERNLLNKWFQDSVKNYIMEALAGPLLKKRLQYLNSIKEVKNYVHNMISNKHKKYMGIINAYYEALGEVNCREAFCSKLVYIINDSIQSFETSDSFNTIIRKQFVCILLLYFFDNQSKYKSSSFKEISSFFDLWNMCFPQEFQSSKKKSKQKELNESTVEAEEIQLESSIFMTKNSTVDLTKQSIESLNPVTSPFQEKFKLQPGDFGDNENLNIFSEQLTLPENSSSTTCSMYLFKNNEMNMSFPANELALTPSYEDRCLDRTFVPESYNCFFSDDFYQLAQTYQNTNTLNYQDSTSIFKSYLGDSGCQSYPVTLINPQSSSQSHLMVSFQRFCGSNNEQSLELSPL